MRIHRLGSPRTSGFSLIEILIAVVVLATGLLALTALQGRLAQASAEAKVRSRVAALLTSRMEGLRAGAYDNAVLNVDATTGTTTTTYTCSSNAPAWLCTAQTESAVGSLTVTQVVTRYLGTTGTSGAFTVSGAAAANVSTPEFKRIALQATWDDATGVSRRLGISTDMSPLSLTSNTIPRAPGGAGVTGSPVVRQDNPAGPGVIPIAIGGGDATAASNPRPEVLGKNNNQSVVGTRFDVLTYEGLSGASVIQRRVETAVVGCKCQYGAGGTALGTIYQKPQWPAEWTGERYEVLTPTGATQAPGEALTNKSGPAANTTQSALCTECCRDHHDATANTVKFDPERDGTNGYSHYTNSSGTLQAVTDSNATQYIEACRLVRVDGFWRTATDMYAKHYGLIDTETVNGVKAKTGAPSTTAVTAYQNMVKTYLGGYATATPAGSIANKADGGQTNGKINITAPPPADERYLHARGLYVDYLNQKARARITKAYNACTGSDKTECILPYLPFTTINSTELSYWEPRINNAQNTTVLSVATGSSLVYNPLQPTRGRTNAKSTASNGSQSDAYSQIGRSNAGVAIASPVDPDDASLNGSDKQEFQVVASGTTTIGQNFTVRLNGLPQTADTNTSNDPALAWSNATGGENCNGSFATTADKDPNDYACNTYGTLGILTSLTVQNYFQVDKTQSTTITCVDGNKTVTASYVTPKLVNYQVTAANVDGTAASSITATNDNTSSEVTTVVFTQVASGSLVQLTFANQNNGAFATIKTCKVTGNNPGTIQSVTWNESWAN